MSWIKKISYAESTGTLRKIYDRIADKDGYIDNILTIHGQRPNSLEGHMALYKNVLHSSHNTLSKWKLELLGVYTSILNGCTYCVSHHFTGMRGLLKDDQRAEAIRAALESEWGSSTFQGAFSAEELAILSYARKLTLTPAAMEASDVDALKANGYDEGEILEINQVVSYFCYVNRTATGLGVNLDGDILGLSPGDSEDSDNWQHGHAKD